MTRRILVTGANGFVGTYLCDALTNREGTAVIRLGAGRSLSPDCLAVDLLDRAAVSAVIRTSEPDVIIHLAAQSSVARGAAENDETWSVNLSGSLNLALAVAHHAPEATVLFVSSSEVYGASFLAGPVTETTATLPMNAYARSKRLAEAMFDAVLAPSTKLIVARPFNHTGPGQSEQFVLPSFAAQISRIERGVQPPILSVGNIDVRRDFLDVRDVIDAYLVLLDVLPRLPHRFTCNIASGTARPLRDFVDILRDLSRVPCDIAVDPARLRLFDLPVATGAPALLHATTGWTPRREIRETLTDILEAARQGRQ